ncbi:hypothetical protein [Motiliproteus sp. MSK22-1]|uniref:hypothetical protein n=1 Tax=Motiliproteus sp. MSK22-1 TaxID=1897630 RepID=UPI0009757D81|nr:hypothetical protein [Motiliproteus sp. MSK22-1]OMH37543.1 hypothetical protein BGP75_09205 [Motiliproteus sp. MSK22-1]
MRDENEKNSILFIMICFLFLILSGCFEGSSTDSRFYQVFDKIKTDQFTRSYGRGGIYWVSDNRLILDGIVKNKQGVSEHGVYQVTLDGTYTRLVEILDFPVWYYCFSDNILYVRNLSKKFNIVTEPKDFEIRKEVRLDKPDDSEYSPLRCSYAKRPGSTGGYISLLKKDGYIRNTYVTPEGEITNTIIVNDTDETLVELNIKAGELIGRPSFLQDRNAYFGYIQQDNCALLWWLYRDDWSSKTEKRCFGGWASSGSIKVLSTRVGLFVVDYSRKGYKTYLFSKDQEFKLERVSARAATVSPDGCKVAYASGKIGYGKTRFSQVLKIFNVCQFIKEQGSSTDES